MKNMILVDIETMDFSVDTGIYEIALLVIEDGEIVLTKHIAEVEDESLIHLGMGKGYANICEDESKKRQFQEIMITYKYPVVAHNVAFDRKFLVHYGWLDEDYECFDSVRAIKYANPDLFSYSLDYLMSFYGIDRPITHIAIEDVKALYEVIRMASPTTWIPLYKVSPKKFKSFVEATASVEGQSTIFEGKRMVFTGASPFPRVLMKEIATKCGATVTGSVSTKTDLLICGENPGSKLNKAKELEVEIQTDEWFIDAISKDINLSTATISRRSVAASVSKEVVSYRKIPELEGKIVNIALLPFRAQSKVEDILVNHMGVSGLNKGATGHKVDVIIHRDNREYELLKKAKEMQIKTISLSRFNRMILD